MAATTVDVEVRLKNPEDVNRLLYAVTLANDIAVDQPWNDDAKQVVRLISKALKGLTLRPI